ncbi:MAG TPA: peroxiredoxin, partial [Gammaproteobacteria bacterium]|nr:peroxiredoxin [Gammaproteobacteria bacterium]
VEGQEFAELHSKFKRQNTIILGVSRDSIKSHENFKAKFDFPFDLLSDSDETLCNLFDVIKEKNMYGKKVMGIERSTFLIGTDGKLKHEWRKVKAKGHAQEVLDTVKNLNK